MIPILIIISLLFSGIVLIGYLEYGLESASSFFIIPLIITLLCLGVLIDRNTEESKSKQPIIDLPEEYSLLSRVPNKPDTLLGYIRNDTIFIKFNHIEYVYQSTLE